MVPPGRSRRARQTPSVRASCGDGGAPVSDAYALPFAFTGTLHRVVVTLGDDGLPDPAATGRAALAEQ
ncbi:MAG: hypothetical protein IT340_07150 [Chloroflexi bacterium]|nr:hypothetical protein [Chloroflexota bacterium]